MKSLLIKHKLSTHLLSFLLAINTLLVGSFYHVFADESYNIYENGSCTDIFLQNGQNRSSFIASNNSSEIRFIGLKFSSGSIGYIFISLNSFKWGRSGINTSCPVDFNSSSTYKKIDNVNTYSTGLNFFFGSWADSSDNTFLYPVITLGSDIEYSTDNAIKWGYYYTFGEGAIEPLPPTPLYGDLINVGFKTDIAGGNGGAYKQNLDTISWNTQIDSNNNPIPLGSLVDIVAVWGYWNDTTMTNMLNKDYLDFIVEDTFTVGTTRVENGSISFTWQDVYNKIDSPLGPWQEFLLSIFRYEDELYKYGWYYKIRWRNLDYTSEWKTIYTSTSDASDSETIVNSTYISNEVINVVNNVNTQNNTTTEWTYDDITIDVDLTGIERLLKQIRDLVNSIYQWLKQFNINTGGDLEEDYPEIDNNGLNETIDELIQYEDEFNSNLNDNLEQLPSSSLNDFGEKFIASSNWVRDQYNRLTLNTPFYNLIVFSLFVGLALLLIGKYI